MRAADVKNDWKSGSIAYESQHRLSGRRRRRPEPHSTHTAAPAPPTVDHQPPAATMRSLAAHKRALLDGEAGLHIAGRWRRDGGVPRLLDVGGD